MAIVATGKLNLRRGPGEGFAVTAQANLNDQLTVIGRNATGDWLQVIHQESVVWVAGRLTTIVGALETVPIVEVKTPTAVPTRTPVPGFPPVGDFFGYGIRAHIASNEDLDFVLSRSRELKFDWLQLDVRWDQIESQKSNYDWTLWDDAIGALADSGLKLLVTITAAPAWSRSSTTDKDVEGPPENPATFTTFVRQFAQRYHGRVQAIEIWNGQNLWYKWGREPLSPRRYVDLLCQAYFAIKAVDPGIIVVSGGLEPTRMNDQVNAIDDTVFLEQMYEAGAQRCFDVVGAHPYGYNNPPDTQYGFVDPAEPSYKNNSSYFFRNTLEKYHAIMQSNGDTNKRIWLTAFGWASDTNPPAGFEFAGDNSRQEQADYIVAAYELGRRWGWVGTMFVSNLNAATTYAESTDQIYSLWREDKPTLAYERFRKAQAGP
ncbi:MAG: hypothetical protein CVU38_06370 [Chloroflexi bacterium HGW-Chloroflexi-1]|nr:MAG: hypothetical protein CVU38_06370 [Chloroflexi bacterium HGW-Chloroflexi-1]